MKKLILEIETTERGYDIKVILINAILTSESEFRINSYGHSTGLLTLTTQLFLLGTSLVLWIVMDSPQKD